MPGFPAMEVPVYGHSILCSSFFVFYGMALINISSLLCIYKAEKGYVYRSGRFILGGVGVKKILLPDGSSVLYD
jgi:hypothetical protein